MRTTDKELRLLTALQAALRAGIHAGPGAPGKGMLWFTPGDLQHAKLIEADNPVQGLHRTAASLVRKGLVQRRTLWSAVHYGITLDGKELLGSLESDRLLPCGCPARHVRDCGHQEGCKVTS